MHFISRAQGASGVSFHEAQVAQARLWLGETYGTPGIPTSVSIKIPQPTQEGIVKTDKESKEKAEEIPMPRTMEEARRIVRRFEQGAVSIRGDEAVSDSVAQHVQEDTTSLLDEKWLGTEEEELSSCVTFS